MDGDGHTEEPVKHIADGLGDDKGDMKPDVCDINGATAPLSRLGFAGVLAEAKLRQDTRAVNIWINRWSTTVGMELYV